MGLQVACLGARAVSSSQFELRKPAVPDGLTLQTAVSAPVESVFLSEEFVRQWGGVTIHRDAEYLRWRIFDNPHVKAIVRVAHWKGKPIGWVAYSLGDDGMGYLIDLLAIRPDAVGPSPQTLIRILLGETVVGCRDMGATVLRGWSVTGHPFDQMVRQEAEYLGFYHLEFGHTVVRYSTAHGQLRYMSRPFGSWYVTRLFTEGLNG